VDWKFQHIPGHQDDDPSHTLDRWAILNINMDLRAKAYWASTRQQLDLQLKDIYGEPWGLWIGDEKICTDIRSRIVHHIHGNTAKAKW